MPAQEYVREQELGDPLRYWRQQRGKSQLDVSVDTGISQRHLSFVESGRSVPSRDVLLTISDGLDIPLRERNVLLLASGYAPVYSECDWEAPEMALLTLAVERVLRQHEPHPAIVLDRYWNVIKTNEAAPRFFSSFVDLSVRKQPRNLLDLMLDPAGMRPFIEDWERVAAGFLQRVSRESLGHVVDQKTIALLPKVLWEIVKRAAEAAGIDKLAPHDLRRTCAHLCHLAVCELDQIQFLLGHVSIQTTEHYPGCKQKLRLAVNDKIGIEP